MMILVSPIIASFPMMPSIEENFHDFHPYEEITTIYLMYSPSDTFTMAGWQAAQLCPCNHSCGIAPASWTWP
ncbi:MAG: hypothetical protein EOO77_40010 [Oxalobacteraceae bacterium]|nr:MAG: hypothetical protein EOO77_40010 [Oxalobacteraceae bacterium]